MLKKIIVVFVAMPLYALAQPKLFNDSWQFTKDIDSIVISKLLDKDQEVTWEPVTLPHTASIEPIQKTAQHWQGTCYYRKYFSIPPQQRGKHIAIQFDAAMQVADVYLNGKHVFRHLGGYLPFYIDVSDKVKFEGENSILVKLNNEDNALVPPGKPLKGLDFNYYSGIYRNAWLIVKDKLHITNAVSANRPAGGGVSVHSEEVTSLSANLVVKTEVTNAMTAGSQAEVRVTVSDQSGKTVGAPAVQKEIVNPGDTLTFNHAFLIPSPKLWSPETPHLYTIKVELLKDGKLVDGDIIRTGVRKVRISKEGFFLNDTRIVIRGTNRHQDYPYIGNAVSDNAQYRDAYKIKMAGFNFVRSSHYPQSPAFLDACDELGLMVMDAIPGWQYVGNDVFQENSFQDIRDMIRRDRNHPSIVMWEASLNESGMRKNYMEKAHAIVHEEMPFEGVYSAGWINDVYDVFLPARQHGKAPDYWKKYNEDRPMFIAEYGDWEYYAQNAGFNQTAFKDLKEEERTSRQLRGHGEKRLLQQALNYQEAHNDNLYNPGLGDANWLMFDYNRGYADDIESSGIMDILRLPKFSYYFYQSQADPVTGSGNTFNKPMIFIANYWDKGSSTSVRVFSNCDEVELFLNGKSLGKKNPDTDQYSTNLKHPPFTFQVSSFIPGTLSAVGYIKRKKTIETRQQTPEVPVKIRLRADYSGKDLSAGQNDVVFVYAEIIDRNGTVVPGFSDEIKFAVDGDAGIIGMSSPKAEAGIAAILLKAGDSAGKIKISATGNGLDAAEIVLEAR